MVYKDQAADKLLSEGTACLVRDKSTIPNLQSPLKVVREEWPVTA